MPVADGAGTGTVAAMPIPHTDAELAAAARAAGAHAYVPYSGFRVGAVLVAADGRTFTGSNVENASYGLTICAERNALFAAAHAGVRHVTRLAVSCLDAAPDATPSQAMPCGACRQVMAEFAAPDFVAVVDGVGTFSLDDLLPGAFTLRP